MTHTDVKLVWRPVRGPDGRFADWVRDLSDRAGVYLIRSDPAKFEEELLYIGESHTYHEPGTRRAYRGLYRTLTRHFHGHNWSQGLTYDPDVVEVAVILTTPEQAISYQDFLINLYRPRDNEQVKQMRLEAWGISPEEAAYYENLANSPDTEDAVQDSYDDEYPYDKYPYDEYPYDDESEPDDEVPF